MREALLIARREYVERIGSKAFRISTVLIPLFFALIFGAGALSGKLSGGGVRHIVVASDDPLLAESVRAELIAAENAAGAVRRNPSSRLTVEVKAPLAESD
jgi:ABC-2 type transport system permease protein